MSAREDAWQAYLSEPASSDHPVPARDVFNAAWDAATKRAYEQAAKIAEQDAVGVTLQRLGDFDVVRWTGQRIALNIQAAANRETR